MGNFIDFYFFFSIYFQYYCKIFLAAFRKAFRFLSSFITRYLFFLYREVLFMSLEKDVFFYSIVLKCWSKTADVGLFLFFVGWEKFFRIFFSRMENFMLSYNLVLVQFLFNSISVLFFWLQNIVKNKIFFTLSYD